MEKWERKLAKELKRKYPRLKKYSDEKLIYGSYRMLDDIMKQAKGQKTSEEE